MAEFKNKEEYEKWKEEKIRLSKEQKEKEAEEARIKEVEKEAEEIRNKQKEEKTREEEKTKFEIAKKLVTLINCPTCSNKISVNAATCPKCGEPMTEDIKSTATDKAVKDEVNDQRTKQKDKVPAERQNKNNASGGLPDKARSYRLVISIALIVLLCGAGGMYLFKGVNYGLRNQVTTFIKKLDDIKYGFRVGMSYIDFKNQNFEIQKNINRIEETFSGSKNHSDLSSQLISSLVSAKVSANVLDCIWQYEIKRSSMAIAGIVSVSDPDSAVSLCVMNYTYDNRHLKNNQFYKNIYSKLENYEKVILPQRHQEGIASIEEAKRNQVTDYFMEIKRCEELQKNLFNKYLVDFMSMYSEEVDKIQLALK
ncbi:MAG: zinc ribbon domain-containing protein [Nitrospirae bacterium]|nr:zinc ribbon domain-containing protein [Nitrospirota bacterium]